MQEAAPNVIVIPAKADAGAGSAVKRQLRAAACCRVSTDNEEQLTSYKAQKNYYTDKIMGNPEWILAGIFGDEGISGTSTKNAVRAFHVFQPVCTYGTSCVRRVRNPVPPLYLDAERQPPDRLALRQQAGLREEILQTIPYPG